jgi:hypothetical protein
MHRFSFGTPPAKTTKSETKATPSLLRSSAQQVARRPSLRLFKRRSSRTPSLDELASPLPFLPSECGAEDEDEEATDGHSERRASDEVDGGYGSDDERERLRRAKARATQMRSVSTAAPVRSPPNDAAEHTGAEADADEDELEEEQEEEEDAEEEEEEASPEMGLSTDVAELQRQVRALLRAQVQAEDAWRLENAQLREQLTLAEARMQTQATAGITGSSRKKRTGTDATPAPTPRERELLRLLVRIVGKEQIHALLVAPTPAGANPSAELRRRLLARAKAPPPPPSRCGLRPATRRATPSPSKISESSGATATAAWLRKHEMSAAM